MKIENGKFSPPELQCGCAWKAIKACDLLDSMFKAIQKYKLLSDRISDVLPYADVIPNCCMVKNKGISDIHSAISSNQFWDGCGSLWRLVQG
ncbi:hypothetical protein [Ethanoligenens harbinense]|uniref:hypothetical protein n=1 Tax=Ethanoligenens harbinense TaxID=253239 RepID=UPI0010BF7CFE|nr:hypothetical protein [Ethanoligenens harbinense]